VRSTLLKTGEEEEDDDDDDEASKKCVKRHFDDKGTLLQ